MSVTWGVRPPSLATDRPKRCEAVAQLQGPNWGHLPFREVTPCTTPDHSSLPNDNLLEGYMAAHMKVFLVDAYVTPRRTGRYAHSLAPGF